MDPRSWRWRRRSSEKNSIADTSSNCSTKHEEDERGSGRKHKLDGEKTDMESDSRVLNENLFSDQDDCNAMAGRGRERSEKEISLQRDIDRVLQQKAASEERVQQLDAALKECMQQLRSVRKEQEIRVHGAVVRTSEEFEKIRVAWEEKLAATSSKLSKLDSEKTQLIKTLSGKEKVIEDLTRQRDLMQGDFDALKLRLESFEKQNDSLKYEVLVLEKELDIRSKDSAFNFQIADIAQKQCQETTKKVAKLEMECQRLRIILGKKFSSPTKSVKTRNEVEMLGRDLVEMRRKSSPPTATTQSSSPEAELQMKRMQFLNERLRVMEQKNTTLVDALNKKSRELQFSRSMYSRTASRLSKSEEQIPAASSDDKANRSESWASALLSELEHFKNEKQSGMLLHRNINLIDDFSEMEKLASSYVDRPIGSFPDFAKDKHTPIVTTGYASDGSSNESGWLRNLLNMLVHYSHVAKRNPHEVLEDLKVALEKDDPVNSFVHGERSFQKVPNDGNGLAFQASPLKFSNPDAASEGCKMKGERKFNSDVYASILKILELLEGINIESCKDSGYVVRMFQWKSEELSLILQQFVETCNALLTRTVGLENFTQQVASYLEWIMNHCFSLQDVSSMKDAIRSNLDWDESSDSNISEEDMVSIPLSPFSNVHNNSLYPVEKEMTSNGRHSEMDYFPPVMECMVTPRKSPDSQNAIEKLQHDSGSAAKNSIAENQFQKKSVDKKSSHRRIKSSRTTNKDFKDDADHWNKLLRNDQEIAAASEKLAECQETIINLGKQLNSLSSPSDSAIAAPPKPASEVSNPTAIISRRSSLIHKILVEDTGEKNEAGNLKPDQTKSHPDTHHIVPHKTNGNRSGIFLKLFGRNKKGKTENNTLKLLEAVLKSKR